MRFLSLIALLTALFFMPCFAQEKGGATTDIAVETPFQLTLPDGTGLKLVSLNAQAVIDDPLAFTELKLVFENPQDRQIEGRFQVILPEGATVSRFAMKINGGWMEGEVVEKQAARRAYEDALHRKVDPALLEQDAGNRFNARVFPIPAKGQKELIISWSQELTKPGEAYRLPLLGLPQIDHLKLRAFTRPKAQSQQAAQNSSLGGTTGRYQVIDVEKRDFKPDQDWILGNSDALDPQGEGLRNGELALMRITLPESGTDGYTSQKEAVILFDTSASRSLSYDARIEKLRNLAQELSEAAIQKITVIAFDQTSEVIFKGKPGDFGQAEVDKLKARRALGATDADVLFAAAESVKAENQRLFLVGDGMFNAGNVDLDNLRTRVQKLKDVGYTRIDAYVDTTARDADALKALVSTLAQAGQVIDANAPKTEHLSRLMRNTASEVKISVPDSTWLWPTEVRGLQGGDPLLVYAELPVGKEATLQLSGNIEARFTPAMHEAERPLLERAVISARIARLTHMQSMGDRDLKSALKSQITELSVKHRVLSPYTALVVLESEWDYQRFNIDRNALTDIMVIGPAGIELEHRNSVVTLQPEIPVRPPRPPVRRETVKFAPPERARRGDDLFQAAAPARAASAAAPARAASAAREEAESAPMAQAEALEESEDEMPGEIMAPNAAPAAAQFAAGPAGSAPAPSMAVEADEEPEEDMRPDLRVAPEPPPVPSAPPAPPATHSGREEYDNILKKQIAALSGEMQEIDEALKRERIRQALELAWKWLEKDPTNMLAYIALGRALQANGQPELAARAFGSIIDLYPSRADMRRVAANWLETLTPGRALAIDCYRKALADRPDHPSVYHMLAMALARDGQYAEALDIAIGSLKAKCAWGRFNGVQQILREDAAIIAQAWLARDASKKDEILRKLERESIRLDDQNTIRFIVTWETDANDVDFHIFDKDYNHAFYSRRALASGGHLYADITTGYGPECFTIKDPSADPYLLLAHYYSRGPMGYGAGRLQIIRHDGKGHLGFDDRNFVIMNDHAYVDMGKVTEKTAAY